MIDCCIISWLFSFKKENPYWATRKSYLDHIWRNMIFIFQKNCLVRKNKISHFLFCILENEFYTCCSFFSKRKKKFKKVFIITFTCKVSVVWLIQLVLNLKMWPPFKIPPLKCNLCLQIQNYVYSSVFWWNGLFLTAALCHNFLVLAENSYVQWLNVHVPLKGVYKWFLMQSHTLTRWTCFSTKSSAKMKIGEHSI